MGRRSRQASNRLVILFFSEIEAERWEEFTLSKNSKMKDAETLPPLRLAVLGAGTFALAAWAPLLK